MSKGEIPISYIIAIVLGVIVLALLGYMIFSTYGPFRGAAAEATCKSQLLQYCSFWSAEGYDESKKPSGGQDCYTLNQGCKEFSTKFGGNNLKQACQAQLK